MASQAVGFSPDARYAWSYARDATQWHRAESRRWEVGTGAPAGQSSVNWAILSPSGDVTLNGDFDHGWIQRIDLDTPLFQWAGHSNALAVSPDSRLVVSADTSVGQNEIMVVRRLPGGEEYARFPATNRPSVAHFSPDGAYLISDRSGDCVLRAFEISGRRELWHEVIIGPNENALDFSANGSRFLRWSTGDNSQDPARVYQTRTGRLWTLIRPGRSWLPRRYRPMGDSYSSPRSIGPKRCEPGTLSRIRRRLHLRRAALRLRRSLFLATAAGS